MSSGLVDSFGGSFFQWFQTDVLPYIIGSVCILVFIATLALDIILIKTLRDRDMLKYPCNRFVLELAVMDILAAFFIVLISAIVAFMRSWKLSSYLCYTHAITITWFYLLTFGMLTVLFLERTIKMKKPELYERVFQSSRCVSILSFTVWMVDLGIAMVAVTDWITVDYNFFHAACVVQYTGNVIYLSLVFVIGIGTSTIVCVVCYYIMIKTKLDQGKQKPKKKDENDDKSPNPFEMKSLSRSNAPGAGSGAKPKNKLALMAAKKKIKKAVTKAKVSRMFDFGDDKSDPDFHMAVTYLIVFCLMLVCYTPYFSINFADYVDSDDIWGGYYTITVILVMLSYCMKPIIYLSHNRHYRKGYKQTMPEKVVVKAASVTATLGKMMDKIDKVMFKTPGKKKLDATLSTHMFAKRWLRIVRRRKKQGTLRSQRQHLNQRPNLRNVNEVSRTRPSDNSVSKAQVTPYSPVKKTSTDVHHGAAMVAGSHYNNSMRTNPNVRGEKPPVTVLREESYGDDMDEKPLLLGNHHTNNPTQYNAVPNVTSRPSNTTQHMPPTYHQQPTNNQPPSHPYKETYESRPTNANPQTSNGQPSYPQPVRRQDSWGDFIDEPSYINKNRNDVRRRESISPGSQVVSVGLNNSSYNSKPRIIDQRQAQPTSKPKMSSISTNPTDTFNGYYINNNDMLPSNNNDVSRRHSFPATTNPYLSHDTRKTSLMPQVQEAEESRPSAAVVDLDFI